MTICYWVCPQCSCRINSPDIPQVGRNRQYGDGDVTEDDVAAACEEYDAAIKAHVCE